MFKKEEKNTNKELLELPLDQRLNKYDFLANYKSGDYHYLGKFISVKPEAFKDNFDKKKAFEYARLSNGINVLSNPDSYSPKTTASISALIIGVGVMAAFKIPKVISNLIKDSHAYSLQNVGTKMYFTYTDEKDNVLYGSVDRPYFHNSPIMSYHPIARTISYVGLLVSLSGIAIYSLTAIIPFFQSIFGKNGVLRKAQFDDSNPQVFIPKYYNDYHQWKNVSEKETKNNISKFVDYSSLNL